MLFIILLTEFSYIFRYTVIFFTPVYCGSWIAPKSVDKSWGHFYLFILSYSYIYTARYFTFPVMIL